MVSDVLKIVPIVLVAATPIFLFLIWSCCGSGSTSVIDFMDLMDGNNSSADGGTDLEDATTTSSSASLQQQQQSQPQQSQQPQQQQGEQQQLHLPWSEEERAQARHDIEHHLVTTKVEKQASSSSSSAGSYTTRSTSTTTTLSSDQNVLVIADMDETDAEDYEVVVEASSTSNMSCCSICLNQYKQDDWIARSMNAECPHVFHKECILDWLVTRTQQQQQQLLGSATTNTTTTATTTNIAECPICRREFLVYNMSDNTEETANYILDMDAIGNDNENTHQLQPTTHNNNNNSDLETTTTTTQLSLSTLPGTPSTMDHHHDQPTSTTDMGADTVPTNENDDANDSPV